MLLDPIIFVSRAPAPSRGKDDGPAPTERDDGTPPCAEKPNTGPERKTGGAASVLVGVLLTVLAGCHDLHRLCYTPEDLECDDYHEALKTPVMRCCCYSESGELDQDPSKECVNAICSWTDKRCPTFWWSDNHEDGSGVQQPGMATPTRTPNPCGYVQGLGCMMLPTPEEE